jgi:hypothetical protein
MSKIAGIKNKSPETYPQATAPSTVLETGSKTGGTVVLNDASYTSLLSAPVSLTVTVSAKFTVMFSGVLQEGAPAITTVQLFLEEAPLSPPFTVQAEVPAAVFPVSVSFVFETALLSPGTYTFDVKGETAAGASVSLDASLVVMATSA